MFVALFTAEFLNLRKELPAWNKAMMAYVVLSIIGFLFSLFGPYNLVIVFAFLVCVPGELLALAVSVAALLRGFRPARYYLAGFVALFSSLLVNGLSKLDVIPVTTMTEYAPMLGTGLIVVLLSLALVNRVNVLRRDKEEAQRRSAETLEQQVQERTQELKQAYEQLTEHDRLKSRFFANVSHELRTPLTLILTPHQRLLAGEKKTSCSAVKDQLRSMSGNTQRLLRLVNQLLDFSKLESGAATVSFELQDIRAIVAALVQGFMPFARSKELKLDLRVPDDLPQIYVDPAMVEKSVSNLLSNACKFTAPGGTVLVRISSDDKTVKIAIKDSGIGIAQEDLSRIFERFRQADGSAARRYEGTGIGLALSKELVELMGGTLEVDSDIGVGSTFTVSLPLGDHHIQDPSLIRSEASVAESEEHARAAATALAAETGLREETGGALAAGQVEVQGQEDSSKPVLLVVEDNPDMRALVADICQEEFRVIAAENGRTGLEKIQQHQPAIVVLDVMMPEMDGHEVLRRVRADPATASLPVIMLH